MTPRFIVAAALFSLAWLIPGSAAAVNATPTFVNIYWVASGGDATTWSQDIAATALGAGPSTPHLTIDSIDSFLKSMLVGDYFTSSYLTDYGVTVNQTPLTSLVIGDCKDPPANISDLVDTSWVPLTPLDDFIGCVLTNNPGLTTQGNPSPDPIVLNIILPPSVGAKNQNNDRCTVGSPPANGSNYVSHSHDYTLLPTEHICNAGLESLMGVMAHEMVETTTEVRDVADTCEANASPPDEPFLSLKILARYNKKGSPSGTCVPSDSDLTANPTPVPVLTICGSGAGMTVQTTLQNTPNRPWDFPAANGFSGSLYMGLGVEDFTGNHKFSAGFEHFANSGLAPVMTGSMTWDVPSGFLQINGLGSGYNATHSVGLTDKIWLTLYDGAWGQPVASQVYGTERASQVGRTWPQWFYWNQWWNPAAGGMLYGVILGKSGCGIANHIVGPRPIDSAGIIPTSDDVGSSDGLNGFISNSANDPSQGGQFAIPYAPIYAGPHTILMKNGAQLANPPTVSLNPALTSIGPHAIGDVAGNQPVTLNGWGFKPGAGVSTAAFGTAAPVPAPPAGPAPPAQSIQAQVTTPATPIAKGAANPFGVGDVTVVATVATVPSNASVTYTYIKPQVPYWTYGFTTAKNGNNVCFGCSCTATVYNADGSVDNTVPGIQVVGAVPPNTVIPNGGTTTCTCGGNVTATVQGTGKVASGTVPSWLSGCLPLQAVLWEGPLWYHGPNPDPLALVGRTWSNTINPAADPYGWDQPSLTILGNGALPQLTVTAPGLNDLWSERSIMSHRVTEQLTAVPPGAPNLCLTGHALNIQLQQQTAAWQATVQFGLSNEFVPPANARILAQQSQGYWVEMPSTIGSGTISATISSTTFQSGRYALAIYSPRSCSLH